VFDMKQEKNILGTILLLFASLTGEKFFTP
jgi:hypothetical protein